MKRSTYIPAALLLSTAGAFAADEAPAAVEQQIDLMKIFNDGGVMMIPLAVLSVAAVVMILLFMLTIRRNAVVSDRFMNNAEAMIRKRDFLGLIGYCHRQNQCMARIAQKALEFMTKNSSATFSDVREVAESEGSRQVGMLTSRITYLADVGSVAPMVGLLGTVIGMIKSFMNISTGGFEGARQMQLAAGVSEALITTAAGLVVGIPALVFYSIFRGRVQKYIAELEAASTHFMATLHSQIQRQAAPPQQQAPSSRRHQEDFGMPVPSPLGEERPDLHGI